MEKFDYKISYLELAGELFTGAGIVVVVKHEEESYEGLFWMSPDAEKVADRLILPKNFLDKKGVEKSKELPEYEELVKLAWKVIPGTRESILKEIYK
jgi:hypothetical protein